MTLVPIDNRYAGEKHHSNGSVGPVSAGAVEDLQAAPKLDVAGAVFRRKFVILLLALIGTGLGYLSFTKQPEKYSSSLRLMIWSQAPPKIVQGDSFLKSSAIPKHQNLLLSEVVLKKAIEISELNTLGTLSNSVYPVGKLKGMLSAQSISSSDDTLIVSAAGENPEDLPKILNSVVASYQQILDEDSKAAGKDAIDIIESYQIKMDKELKVLDAQYLELVGTMGMTVRSDDQGFVNPYVQRYNELVESHDAEMRKLVDTDERLRMLTSATESGDESQISVVAIEGRKHLGLSEYANPNNGTIGGNNSDINIGLQALNTQIRTLEDRVMELQFEYRRLSRNYGSGSPEMKSLSEDIRLWGQEINRLEEEKGRALGLQEPQQVVDHEQVRKETELRWIKLYFTSLKREKERILVSLKSLETQTADAREKASSISGNVAKLNILHQQIDEKRNAGRVMMDQLSEISLLSDDYNMFKVRIIDSPKPGYKIEPVMAKCLSYGAFLGSLLGFGLALLIDRFDMSFRTPAEIFGWLGAPVVGRIPKIRSRSLPNGFKGSATLVTAHRGGSSAAEAFRAARTSVFFTMTTQNYNSFLITSPSPGDGKSTFACNLAISIAQAGKKTLLIDADFRRPRVHRYMGEELEPGITEILNSESTITDAVRPSLQDDLFLLTTGKRPRNPGELVTSEYFRDLLDKLKGEFDVLIIDSPPLLPVADATVISSYVDGVYMVMRIRKGVKISAQRAKDNLESVNGKLLGVVVNGMDENPHYNEYGYYYNTYYRDYGGYYENGPTSETNGSSRKRIRSK